MLIPSILIALATQTPKYDEAFSAKLLRWRSQFEEVLQEPDDYVGYVHIYSETLGGAYSEGLYPIGSAKKRFVINHNGPEKIFIERRHGKKATVDKIISLVKSHQKRAVKGTLLNYLKKEGFVISPRTKLSKKIRAELESTTPLVGFTYHSMMGGNAWIIKSDGSCMPNHKSDTNFMILPEENDLLKRQKGKQ